MAGIAITEPMAAPAAADFVFKLQQAVGQLFGFNAWFPQQMHGQAFGGFLTDTGQPCDLPDRIHDGRGIVFHCRLLVVFVEYEGGACDLYLA